LIECATYFAEYDGEAGIEGFHRGERPALEEGVEDEAVTSREKLPWIGYVITQMNPVLENKTISQHPDVTQVERFIWASGDYQVSLGECTCHIIKGIHQSICVLL